MEFFLICGVAFGHFFHGDSMWTWEDRLAEYEISRMETCMEIAETAEDLGVDPALAVSVAWIESKFYAKAESKRGARGPMQVIPKYHCPDGKLKGCDLIETGVLALQKYLRKYAGKGERVRPLKKALCHYASGNKCTKQGKRYAASVYRVKWRLDAMIHLWEAHRQGVTAGDIFD